MVNENHSTQIEPRKKVRYKYNTNRRRNQIMKLKKKVQGFLEILLTISIILVFATVESDFTLGYLTFLITNIAIISGVSFVLNKYGRY